MNAIAGDPCRKSQALATILEQIERLDSLLRRLLSVTERDKPRSRCTAPSPFLDSCIAAHIEVARARGVTVECQGDQATASFDPDQMRSAVDNLIINAIQAAPTGSRILVTARRQVENLVFSVHDQGDGPPAGIRAHLFEPFATARADGTGLGVIDLACGLPCL